MHVSDADGSWLVGIVVYVSCLRRGRKQINQLSPLQLVLSPVDMVKLEWFDAFVKDGFLSESVEKWWYVVNRLGAGGCAC